MAVEIEEKRLAPDPTLPFSEMLRGHN